jgi:hypothetical protein
MIIFGYAFDQDDLHRAERAVMEKSTGMWHTCYSTGGGFPGAAVFGVVLSHEHFLFNAVRVLDLVVIETPEQQKRLAEEWAKVPEGIRAKAKSRSPEVYAIDLTDD